MEYVTLNNGVRMPVLGYGVYQVDPSECARCVRDALEVGYRAVDTAQVYQNEEGVGQAVEESGIPRGELFLTTKIWVSNAGYERARASIDRSLEKLRTDYVDLMLVHQPFGDYYGTYRALTEAYRAGRIRAIGVSNFYPDRLADICLNVDVVPAVNQIETHPFLQQREAHRIMEKYGVVHESWGPFAEGRKGFFTNPVLGEIGRKHGRSPAQVALRWLLQRGIVVIPKSTHKDRMAENFDAFSFTLDEADMERIAALDEGESAFFSHRDPDTAERMFEMKL